MSKSIEEKVVAGIDAMVRNAEENAIDKKELDLKIENIKTNQVMGIEILWRDRGCSYTLNY